MPNASELAAKLLRDAATFFDTISEQNPDLAEQMRENASVFRQVSDLVEEDPAQKIGDEKDLQDAQQAAQFVERPGWITDIWEHEAGDRIPFSGTHGWSRCDNVAAAGLIERLKTPVDGQRLVALPDEGLLDVATFWTCTPKFYRPNAKLIHIAGPASSPKDGFFIDFEVVGDGGERRLLPIFSNAKEIHRANIDASLLIDGCELDYMLFFMHLVGGEMGMFRILQRETLDYVRGVLSEREKSSNIAGKLASPRPVGVTVTGAIRFEVDLVYGGTVFHAILDVETTGEVKMIEDEPLCEPIDALLEPLAEDAA